MATKSRTKLASKRTKVKSLPKASKDLSAKSMKKVKGGIIAVLKEGKKSAE